MFLLASASRSSGTKGSKNQRRTRSSRRQLQLSHGKQIVLAALTAAICYYVAFALTVLIGARWGDPSANLVTSFAVSVGSVIAIALAVSAYLSHRAIRHIYLLINILAGLGGILITGWHLARGAQPQWLALDIAGVGAALFVIWVFYYSRSARTFLEDREYFVKRD